MPDNTEPRPFCLRLRGSELAGFKDLLSSIADHGSLGMDELATKILEQLPIVPGYHREATPPPPELPMKTWDVELTCTVTDGMRGSMTVQARTEAEAIEYALEHPAEASWKSVADGGYDDVEVDEIKEAQAETA